MPRSFGDLVPVFSPRGGHVGWIHLDAVLDDSDRYRAFIRSETVYTYAGRHLGEFHEGYFWDKNGLAVAFVDGARGGPPLPKFRARPPRPWPGRPPMRPMTPEPPIAPARRAEWSPISFLAYLTAQAEPAPRVDVVAPASNGRIALPGAPASSSTAEASTRVRTWLAEAELALERQGEVCPRIVRLLFAAFHQAQVIASDDPELIGAIDSLGPYLRELRRARGSHEPAKLELAAAIVSRLRTALARPPSTYRLARSAEF